MSASPNGTIVGPDFTVDYGSPYRNLTGQSISDTVCIGRGKYCASGFNFIGITNQNQLDIPDGILGLSPPSKNAPSFVESLKAQGIINSSIFSFYLTKNATGSKFTFGGYLEEYIKPGSSIIWNSMVPY